MPNLSDYNPAIKYGANLDVNVDLADIRDANGNELLELDTVASAVNYVRIANAATGSSPELSVQGDDSNADLQLTSLGTGMVLVGSSSTGTATPGAGGLATVTINAQRGVITLTQAGIANGSAATIDLTNNKIASGDKLLVTFGNNAHTAGTPYIVRVAEGAGTATIVVSSSGGPAVNGAIELDFIVL